MIDATVNYNKDIADIFESFPQLKVQVYAFGSRIKGTARKNSDLDLVIKSEEPLKLEEFYDIKDAFSESDIPYRVDLSDWSLLSANFKKAVENELELVYKN